MNGPTAEDIAALRLMRWGRKRKMGWSISKEPRPCLTCETPVTTGIPTVPQQGGGVLCGACAASWWDSTTDHLRSAPFAVETLELHAMCEITFWRWAKQRSARMRRRAATKARLDAYRRNIERSPQLAAMLEAIVHEVPQMWADMPSVSFPRITAAPRRR